VTQLDARIVPTITLSGGFNGTNNTGWYPPDSNVAVGPNHVVETVNEQMAIYNKSTGAFISSQSLTSLFSGLDTNGGDFDPSILYDDSAGRFVIEAAVKDTTANKAYIDFAISNSSDPTQGFTEIHQIEVDSGGQYWADNGKIGFNGDAYVYSGNLYTFGGSWGHEVIVTLDKNSVLDQNNATLTDYVVSQSCFGMDPARMHNSSTGGPMWFVESTWNGGSTLNVIRMDNVLSANPTFTTTSLGVNSYGYVSGAVQPGGTVDCGDSRVLNVEWNNGNLVAALNSDVGSDAAAAWFEFNTAGASPTLSQQGVIHPGTGINTYFPAVAVDSAGDLAITYMESSSTEYVSMYVTGRLASDSSGTLEPAAKAVAGTVTLNPSRAGDYGGISLDPSSANTFWAANEYAPSGVAWGSWIEQFSVTNPNPTDQPPTVATPASATPNPVTGTTTNLSVLGADDGGEASLTYTWGVTSEPAGATNPTYSANGTNAAKNTTATFYRAGNYTFQVTITDAAGLTTTSSVTVTVNQTQTSVSVSPASATLTNGATQQFTSTALDQFGKAMATQPATTWSLGAGSIGTISSTGLYTAPASGTGSATVNATMAGMTGSASVTVTSIPAAPTNLTASAVSASEIDLTWQESSTNQTGFTIQRSSNGGNSWTQIAQVGGSVRSYADTTVSRKKSYSYRVQAYNGAGSSGWSNVASASTPSHDPGRTPQFPNPDVPDQVPIVPTVAASSSVALAPSSSSLESVGNYLLALNSVDRAALAANPTNHAPMSSMAALSGGVAHQAANYLVALDLGDSALGFDPDGLGTASGHTGHG
jgi:hypothetical protein